MDEQRLLLAFGYLLFSFPMVFRRALPPRAAKATHSATETAIQTPLSNQTSSEKAGFLVFRIALKKMRLSQDAFSALRSEIKYSHTKVCSAFILFTSIETTLSDNLLKEAASKFAF